MTSPLDVNLYMPATICRSAFFKLLLWGVMWLAAWSPAAAAGPEIVLQPGEKQTLVERGIELLIEEPGETLSSQRVMQPDMAQRWKPLKRTKISLLGERRAVWARFSVRNNSAQPSWVLAIDWPVLSEVQFQQYQPDTQQWGVQLVSGLMHPVEARVRKDPNPSFPVILRSGEQTTILLRMIAPTSITAPLSLWEPKAWQAERYDYAVVIGLLFGILGVMFFYNLSLYIFTRESSFLTYACYLLSIVAYQLCVTGFGPLFVWGGSEWLNDRGYEFFAACSFLAATMFFRRFLNIGQTTPRHMDWLNRGFIAFFALFAVLAIFKTPVIVAKLFSLGGFIVGFVGIYTAGYLSIRGDVLARYFFIAWVTIIVATIVMLLSMVGVVETGSWTKYAQPVGFVLETVLLSIALAARIKQERASKEAAERESQELSRKVELEREQKILAQEHALIVQRKANEELELRVLDRTAELKRALENIELANRELAKLSVTDALTRVHNRRYFDEVIKKEYDRSARGAGPLALVLIDIDFFKKINDSVGHLGGDECLKLVAAALESSVGRSTDLVARYGGEEFAVVLPGTDESQALEVAERIRQAVQDIQFIYRGRRIPISVSLGVVARNTDASRPLAEFITEADQALYAAKEAGRNRVMSATAA